MRTILQKGTSQYCILHCRRFLSWGRMRHGNAVGNSRAGNCSPTGRVGHGSSGWLGSRERCGRDAVDTVAAPLDASDFGGQQHYYWHPEASGCRPSSPPTKHTRVSTSTTFDALRSSSCCVTRPFSCGVVCGRSRMHHRLRKRFDQAHAFGWVGEVQVAVAAVRDEFLHHIFASHLHKDSS